MPAEGTPIERSMYSWEIQEARRVFANRLAYSPVRICECADWPNTIKRLGSWVQRHALQRSAQRHHPGQQVLLPGTLAGYAGASQPSRAL